MAEPKHYADINEHDYTRRARFGRGQTSKWREANPLKAAYLDDHPRGPLQPCASCGQQARSGPHQTKRRWNWEGFEEHGVEPTFRWLCNTCYREQGKPLHPDIDKPLDVDAIDRLRAAGVAAGPPPPPPGYYVEGNHLIPITAATTPPEGTTGYLYDDDDEPDPNRPPSKLDAWFANDD